MNVIIMIIFEVYIVGSWLLKG